MVLVPDIFTKGQDATVVNSPPLVKEGRLMLVGPPGALLQNGSMFSQCTPAAQGNTFPIRRTGWAGWLAMGSVPPAAPHPKDMASHPRAPGDGEWGVGPRVCTCPAGTSLTSVWITT